jgi:transcriptional regulator with XRE-family HTH domain
MIKNRVVNIATYRARKQEINAMSNPNGIADNNGMKRDSVYPYLEKDPPGATIHALREQKGWSIEQLAARCVKPGGGTIDPSTISRIENNKSYTRHNLQIIADALGVQLRDLLTPPELLNIPKPIKDLMNLPSSEQEPILRIAETTVNAYRYKIRIDIKQSS